MIMDNDCIGGVRNVSYEELLKLGIRALQGVGVPDEDARTAAEILLWADLRGISSHGILRLLTYVPRIRKGLINPRPRIEVQSPPQPCGSCTGNDGLGPVVGARGMREAIDFGPYPGNRFRWLPR